MHTARVGMRGDSEEMEQELLDLIMLQQRVREAVPASRVGSRCFGLGCSPGNAYSLKSPVYMLERP